MHIDPSLNAGHDSVSPFGLPAAAACCAGTALFRVAQETLTNVARHAQASRVDVKIQKLPDGIRMEIAADGKYFSVERALPANGGKRLGLLGMWERLEMVGGKFGVESAPGKGTTIQAQIPFGNASQPRKTRASRRLA